jgi:hypothetical protein
MTVAGGAVMPGPNRDTPYAYLPTMLFLGVIAFPIIAGVVGATPLPDDLLGVQQQLIASKDVTRIGANNLQQSWRFDWEPPKAVLRDVWTIVWILGC